MTQVTANGNTYSDDRTAAKDMNDGGARTHLVPMLSDVMVEIADGAAAADAAIAAAIAAAAGAAALTGTSTTSVPIATGSKGFTTQADKQFAVGVWVLIYQTSTPANYMHGQVTAYNSGTGALTVDVQSTGGSGTISAWTIAVAGTRGATGPTGPNYVQAYLAKTSTFTIDDTYHGDLVDVTTGGFTPTWTAAATLTSSFWFEMKNSSTTDVTINPNGSETVDGLTSFVMYPGEHRRFFCNGSAFTSTVLNPFLKVFSANDTFTKPPGYKLFSGLLWGGGGGGAVGTSAPGGGGGACAPFTLPASAVGATETVTIGATAAGSTTATPTAGNHSAFGSLVRANGAQATTTANGGTAYAAANIVGAGFEILSSSVGGPTLFGGCSGDQSASGYGTVYGGAGGAKQGSTAIASVFGGAGGAAGTTGVGSAGAAPGGGGGATSSGANGGAGAVGELRIWGVL